MCPNEQQVTERCVRIRSSEHELLRFSLENGIFCYPCFKTMILAAGEF